MKIKILSFLMKAIKKCSDALEKSSFESTSDPPCKTYLPIIDASDTPRDTVVVIDISISMDIEDFSPTRLKGGIEAGIEYVNARKNPDDRIALVSFSTETEIVLPLSSVKNKGKIIRALRDLSVDGGTDIGKGLWAAIEVFSQEKSDSQRYAIVLTDGHGGRPLKAARKLKEQCGAVIEVVGIGGSPDAVNESLLRKIATTDVNGFTHYHFIKDSVGLKKHYKNLATDLVWKGAKG